MSEHDEEEENDEEENGEEEEPDLVEERTRGSSVTEGDQLQFEPEIELVGSNEAQILVADIPIPGAYQYRRSGDGRESQYLLELEPGESGGDPQYGADEDLSEDDEEIDEPDSPDEEPPETVTIEAYCGHEVAEELRALRQYDETFPVTVEGETLDDMELVELEVEAEGDRPYAYFIIVECREWREYEIDDPLGDDTDYGMGDGEDGIDVEDIPESGEPDDYNDIEVDEGDTLNITLSDGDMFRYARIDATAPGADVQIAASGDQWEISNISIEGGNDETPAIATDTVEDGDGTIENVRIDGRDMDGDEDEDDMWHDE